MSLEKHQCRLGAVGGLRMWQLKRQLDALCDCLIVVTRKDETCHHWIGIREDDKPLRELRTLTKGQFDELTRDAELIIINETSMYFRWNGESE